LGPLAKVSPCTSRTPNTYRVECLCNDSSCGLLPSHLLSKNTVWKSSKFHWRTSIPEWKNSHFTKKCISTNFHNPLALNKQKNKVFLLLYS
jgi:hypothetical protein